VTGKNLNCIRDWLCNREQRVCCNSLESNRAAVISGVPQGSVLGPLLFTLYIDDIDEKVKGKVLKFADDTKLTCKVGTEEEYVAAQSDLNELSNWSQTWLMPFNIEKCKIMHLGKKNPKNIYKLNGKKLMSVEEEVDLGVTFNSDFTFGKQCEKVVSKANSTMKLILKTVTSRSAKVLIPLFNSLVRPKLEYCIQVWRPYLKQDIKMLEKVQKRYTKRIKEVKGLRYEDRLLSLNINSIEARELRADLILVFKILRLNETNCLRKYFSLSNSSTRGNVLKLFKYRSRINLRKNCFSNRIIDSWNILQDTVVLSNTVNVFKSKIGRLLGMSGELL
jgi:hypothetical protein